MTCASEAACFGKILELRRLTVFVGRVMGLFSYAEVVEDVVQDVVGDEFSFDVAEFQEGGFEVDSDQIERHLHADAFERVIAGSQGFFEAMLLAFVRDVFGFFVQIGADGLFYRVFEGFDGILVEG